MAGIHPTSGRRGDSPHDRRRQPIASGPTGWILWRSRAAMPHHGSRRLGRAPPCRTTRPATPRNYFPPAPPSPAAAVQLMDPDPTHRAPPPHPEHPVPHLGPKPRITSYIAAELRDLDAHGRRADRRAPRSKHQRGNTSDARRTDRPRCPSGTRKAGHLVVVCGYERRSWIVAARAVSTVSPKLQPFPKTAVTRRSGSASHHRAQVFGMSPVRRFQDLPERRGSRRIPGTQRSSRGAHVGVRVGFVRARTWQGEGGRS